MASLGYQILVLAPKEWLFHKVKDEKEGNFELKGVDLFGNLRVKGLYNIVKDFKPDVLYSNEPTYSGGSLQAVQVGKELGIKVAIFEWDNIYHTSPMEKKVLENADLFIAGCLGAKDILIQKGVNQNKIAVIPQIGIDTSLFKLKRIKKTFDTIFVGRITKNKGVDLISQAIKNLGLKHMWVGSFDEPSDLFGVKVGWVDYENLPNFYNKAKVFVIASIDTKDWIEQFNYSIGEALSCGLSVVTTNAGEIPNIWGNCPSVCIVPQNDINGLKIGIKEMLNYKGKNGRRFVIEKFSYKVIAKKLSEAFEGIV
jgi:glycosyltransferase involved in cell wall biosynthesis